MITLSKRQKIEIYFNDCRELSFPRALRLETWGRLHWQKSSSPGLSSGVSCCSLWIWGEETPPHPSAPIARYPCDWFGFHFLIVVKTIDLLGWVGRIGSFVHSVSQQRHYAWPLGKSGMKVFSFLGQQERAQRRCGRAHGGASMISHVLGCCMHGPGSPRTAREKREEEGSSVSFNLEREGTLETWKYFLPLKSCQDLLVVASYTLHVLVPVAI